MLTIRISRRVAFFVVVGVFLAIPAGSWASHRFIDVPDDHTFHTDIAWLADHNITFGCNPPAGTEFCPEEFVTRAQMAAFMHRYANNLGPTVVQGFTVDGPADVPDGWYTVYDYELLAGIEYTPPVDGTLVVFAHAQLSNSSSILPEFTTAYCDITDEDGPGNTSAVGIERFGSSANMEVGWGTESVTSGANTVFDLSGGSQVRIGLRCHGSASIEELAGRGEDGQLTGVFIPTP